MRRFESPIQTVLACGDQVGLGTCLFYGEKMSLDFFGLSGTAAYADCSEPPCPMPPACGCRRDWAARLSVRYNKEFGTLRYLAGQEPKSAGCRAEQDSGLRGCSEQPAHAAGPENMTNPHPPFLRSKDKGAAGSTLRNFCVPIIPKIKA